jgi:hypothetical protein
MPRSWARPLPVCVAGRFHGPFLKVFRKNASFSRDASFFEHRLAFLSFQAGEVHTERIADFHRLVTAHAGITFTTSSCRAKTHSFISVVRAGIYFNAREESGAIRAP